MLIDVMTRPNRPKKVICLAEHMLSLGPFGLRECGNALAKCGHRGLAGVLYQLMIEERERAWSELVVKPK